MNVTIITDGKALSRNILTVKRQGGKLDEIIHTCAVSALYHAEQHGDVTKAAELVHAMPASSRRKALIHWLTAFAPLRVQNTEDGKFSGFKLNKGKKAKAFNVEQASATPFWDFTKERNPAEFTIEGFIASVKRRIQTQVEKGKLDSQGVETIRARLATLEV